MKFSFVILTWNRKAFLELCLSALVESIGPDADSEIIVMDNGSDDGTEELCRSFSKFDNYRYYRLKKNYGLNSYKKLLGKATGEYIVVVDDDVLEFPPAITGIFERYLESFTDFGYLALDVVQDEFTNGAKPTADHYSEVVRGDLVVQAGPTGGWCTCFRRRDYRRVRFRLWLTPLDMKKSEDGVLSWLISQKLGLRSGIIKDQKCLHASGPYYSKKFGYIERDLHKYSAAGLDEFVETYRKFGDSE